MIILGVDPGIATIGFGLVEKRDKRIAPVDYGVITTPKEENTPVRLAMLFDALNHLIAKYTPDVIAIEELFFNKNVKTAITVAEARGVILLAAVKSCGNLYEYTPLQIKQALTGNGRAEKAQIQYMVRLLLSLKEIPRPDDAADALAVAICHAHTSEWANPNFI